MALQHYLTMIGAIVSIPFILTPALCMDNDDPSRGKIISTMIFVTGLVTYFQVTWGCRLPIVQVSIVEQNFLDLRPFVLLGRDNFVFGANSSHPEFTAVEMSVG
jgi:xanthine/uracil permease